jgi:hypothetical protein
MSYSFAQKTILAAALALAPFASASADVKPGQAYLCVSASRGGLSLAIPGLTAAGEIGSSLKLFKNARTIRELPATQITDYVNDGESISMNGKDENGKTVIAVKSRRDEFGNLQVQAKIKDAGLIGFACKAVEQAPEESLPAEVAPAAAPVEVVPETASTSVAQ